jgi:hypothetical protein
MSPPRISFPLFTVGLVLAAALVLTLAPTGAGWAQLRGSTDAAPQFSDADRVVIARNKMLQLIVDADPRLVRRVLDALAYIDDAQTRGTSIPGEPQRASSRPADSARPSDNPDLDRLERSSPEAMNDLFQLLKQASSRSRPSR